MAGCLLRNFKSYLHRAIIGLAPTSDEELAGASSNRDLLSPYLVTTGYGLHLFCFCGLAVLASQKATAPRYTTIRVKSKMLLSAAEQFMKSWFLPGQHSASVKILMQHFRLRIRTLKR
jgi:hypothetical protein